MRRTGLLLIDLLLIAAATVFALALRNDLELTADRFSALVPYLGATLVASAVMLPLLGLDRAMWRFTRFGDYLRIVLAVPAILASAVAIGFVYNRLDGIQRAVPVLQGMAMLLALTGVRVRGGHGAVARHSCPA
jgi:FlaA1/EpsC-like NDP-sugar epimerase